MIYYKKKKKTEGSLTLYREDYSDYGWYKILHSLGVVKCDYILEGIHSQAEEICLSGLQPEQINVR